eukprot:gene30695-38426_t
MYVIATDQADSDGPSARAVAATVEKVSSGLPSLAPMALFLINDCVQ